ncbi:transcription factor S [Candidatus Woesearchaeota archaeon]|nr:transcription factor S [Candidatus Woesearchaeota archaeon]
MFCPRCGSILMPKVEKGKKVVGCSCGYKEKEKVSIQLTERPKQERELVVVEKEDENLLPKTEAECHQCQNKEAYFWTVQTRAGDEPETKFLRCTKCKHTWRDYN